MKTGLFGSCKGIHREFDYITFVVGSKQKHSSMGIPIFPNLSDMENRSLFFLTVIVLNLWHHLDKNYQRHLFNALETLKWLINRGY